MAGWKHEQSRTLDELQDWNKADSYPPANRFEGGSGIEKPPA